MKFLVPHKVNRREESGNQVFRLDKSKKVIKAEDVASWKSRDDVLKVAQEEADRILSDMKAAFEKERQRGYREGLEKVKAEQAEHMIEQVARSVDYFETIEKRIIDLVSASVKKIIYDYRDHDRTVAVVKSALSTVRNQKQVLIRVHPSALEEMQNKINSLLAEFPGIHYIDVVSDNRLARDGCMLETDIGLVEVNIEYQLKVIHEAFERVLGK